MSENQKPEHVGNPSSPQVQAAQAIEEKFREKAPDVVDAVPANKRSRLFQAVREVSVSIRSGPLPDPSELAAYDSVIPNGADRIMKMAEAQSAHRISIEATVVSSQQSQATRGQWFGLIIGLTGLSLATYAALHGEPTFGGVIGGTTVGGLVWSFLASRHAERAALENRRKGMPVIPLPPVSKVPKGRK